ncbi:hypothetical protein CR513_37058, partial [Mucuna pruriens]
MASSPEIGTGSGPRKPSISELVSELRDSFLSGDFDLVEEALVAREARLKAELEERKREIGSLKEGIALERLQRINAELELKRLCGENNRKCKVGVLGEKERKVVGVNGSVPLKRNGDGIGSSGGKLGMVTVIDIEDSDEDVCIIQATLDKKETTSCTVITDNEHQSSSGAFQKNLLTGLAQSTGNPKRKFSSLCELDTNIDVLNGLNSDTSSSSSSSSSSSGSFDMDNLPLTSNKKMRADATSLGFNFSQ